MAFLLAFCASGFDAIANFLFKRNAHFSAACYLLASYLGSYFVLLCLEPNFFKVAFSIEMFSLGLFGGAFLVLMMLCAHRALKFGPSGLTFAFQISGSVFAIPTLYMVLGPTSGFIMSSATLYGLLFVLVGLFLAAKKNEQVSYNFSWISAAFLLFVIQTLLFILMHWRTLAFSNYEQGILGFRCTPEQDIWYTQGLYLSACICQVTVVIITKAQANRKTWLQGALGGIINGIGTLLILVSTTKGSIIEKPLLFPVYAVSLMALCNLWSRFFYQEKINWGAYAACSLGILLASLE